MDESSNRTPGLINVRPIINDPAKSENAASDGRTLLFPWRELSFKRDRVVESMRVARMWVARRSFHSVSRLQSHLLGEHDHESQYECRLLTFSNQYVPGGQTTTTPTKGSDLFVKSKELNMDFGACSIIRIGQWDSSEAMRFNEPPLKRSLLLLCCVDALKIS
ncbi:hypothetical protein CBL_09409 [Carabus blaptoides fortunei]